MHIIACVGDNNSLLFNGRRVSRDAAIEDKISVLTKDSTLICQPSSLTVLSSVPSVQSGTIDSTPKGKYFFLEELIPDAVTDQIETVTIFRFNRKYPYDTALNIDLSSRKVIKKEDFIGKSHNKITMEVYA